MASSSFHSIEQACASLTIDEEEIEVIDVGDADINEECVDYRLVLVGRLVTDKHIKFPIMRDTLASVWRPGKGVSITEAATNLYLFQFFHEVDVKRVLEDGPWSFEQNLLVLKRIELNTSPFETDLNRAEFWVQAHNLPASFFTENIAKAIGSSLGEFVLADSKNFNGT